MSQIGKASAKRGKPSYVYAIIGVSLVLFLFGVVGWIFLNIKKQAITLRKIFNCMHTCIVLQILHKLIR